MLRSSNPCNWTTTSKSLEEKNDHHLISNDKCCIFRLGFSNCEWVECEDSPLKEIAEIYSDDVNPFMTDFSRAYDKMVSNVAPGIALKRPLK